MDSRYPLEEIRSRCELVEIISPHVALKRSGKNLKGVCPFHSEKTPSFIVNQETQRYKCFGCGESGDVFNFVMRVEGLTFPEAVEQLARKVGVSIERTPGDNRVTAERDLLLKINQLATDFFRKQLTASKFAIDYLNRRGITPEAADKFRVGYAKDEWRALSDFLRSQRIRPEDAARAGVLIESDKGTGFYDRFRNRLMFPICDVQDRVIAFGGRALAEGDVKYINSPETKVFLKNRTLYALNLARKEIIEQSKVVLVEGYMDALTAHAAGFTNVVASMGTALTQEHVNILSRYTRQAVLAYDADSAGMNAAIRGAPMFEEAEFDVRVAPMPEGEDPDSLIRRGDRAVFAELVAGAIPIPDYRFRMISAKHDLSTRAGQLAMLREAIPIVAEVAQQVERERLIALLAPYHPNYGSGTTPAEVHIRQEIEARRTRVAQQQRPQSGPTRRPVARQGRVDLLSEEGKAVRKAERELLGKIICHGASADDVFAAVPPESFIVEDTKTVATVVREELANRGKLNVDALCARLAGTPGEGLLNELLVQTSESSETPIAELLDAIKLYRNKEHEKRFRMLAGKIQRGEIKGTDKEFSEYWQLVRELHM